MDSHCKEVYQRSVVRRFLKQFVRSWRQAYYDSKESWHNCCIDCEKPLTSPRHKWRRCCRCSWRYECEDAGDCWRCLEEGLTPTLTHHACPKCDCPFNTNAMCLCPEPEYTSEDEYEYVRCSQCGRDCEGGDYEKWRICSRRCLTRA